MSGHTADWRLNLIDGDDSLAAILRQSKTVAVLGAKADPTQAAYYVPAYLHAHGYRILPVNPVIAGRELFGARVVGTLADLTETPDVLEVFRRPAVLMSHAREVLALLSRPPVVWFQL